MESSEIIYEIQRTIDNLREDNKKLREENEALKQTISYLKNDEGCDEYDL